VLSELNRAVTLRRPAQARQHREILQRRRVAERLAAARDVLEQPAHDLAAARLRQGVGETDFFRARQRPISFSTWARSSFCKLGFGGTPCARVTKRRDRLPLDLVGAADDRRLGDLADG
jgi:hypothetical protein